MLRKRLFSSVGSGNATPCLGLNVDTSTFVMHVEHRLCGRDVLVCVTSLITVDGHAERETAKAIIHDANQPASDGNAQITLGADKGTTHKSSLMPA